MRFLMCCWVRFSPPFWASARGWIWILISTSGMVACALLYALEEENSLSDKKTKYNNSDLKSVNFDINRPRSEWSSRELWTIINWSNRRTLWINVDFVRSEEWAFSSDLLTLRSLQPPADISQINHFINRYFAQESAALIDARTRPMWESFFVDVLLQ